MWMVLRLNKLQLFVWLLILIWTTTIININGTKTLKRTNIIDFGRNREKY